MAEGFTESCSFSLDSSLKQTAAGSEMLPHSLQVHLPLAQAGLSDCVCGLDMHRALGQISV